MWNSAHTDCLYLKSVYSICISIFKGHREDFAFCTINTFSTIYVSSTFYALLFNVKVARKYTYYTLILEHTFNIQQTKSISITSVSFKCVIDKMPIGETNLQQSLQSLYISDRIRQISCSCHKILSKYGFVSKLFQVNT